MFYNLYVLISVELNKAHSHAWVHFESANSLSGEDKLFPVLLSG